MTPAEYGVALLRFVSILALVAAIATALANRYLRGRRWPSALRLLAQIDFFVVVLLGMVVGGSYFLSYGLRTGREFGHLNPTMKHEFHITSVYPQDPHALFPSYFADGMVGSQAVTIRVRPYTFHNDKPGAVLLVLANPNDSREFVWDVLYQEAAPFIRIGALCVSWRITLGLLLPIGAALLYARLKWPDIVTAEHDETEDAPIENGDA